MASSLTAFRPNFSTLLPPPRLDLKPLPGTTPLTPLHALAPPLLYYLALLLLPPFPNLSSQPTASLISLFRNSLALLSATLFFRLPLRHYVPFSVGLTYQLALVGLYGGCRVLDAFFISPYLFNHVPRRVKYHHSPRIRASGTQTGADASYFSLHFLVPGDGQAVTETAITDEGWPHDWKDRASWALELELSMRGAGFAWSSADVRYTKSSWRPSVRDRTHSILVHALPVLLITWAVIHDIYSLYLANEATFDDLPLVLQLILTAALGAFLMGAFSLGHSAFALLMSPLAPHPLSYFPPLYTTRVWQLKSVRDFWSFGWHRLFSRLFLVYGVWPGEWLERKLTGKRNEEEADVGKVLGGFVSSALVHSFAVHTVLGGWDGASGEAWFFVENGFAIVLEEGVRMAVMRFRKRQKRQTGGGGGAGGKEGEVGLERWYDGAVGRVWWVCVLLYTGRNFARGWVRAGLVREMAGL